MALDLRTAAVTLRPLTLADHAASVAVENAAFTNPNHRASPDKIAYRLTACPALSLGLFVDPAGADVATLVPGLTAADVDAAGRVLVAQAIGTRCHDAVASDGSMSYPADWRTAGVDRPDFAGGHKPDGATAALHSLAVAPAVQGTGAGTRLLAAYAERLRPGGAAYADSAAPPAERIALICRDYLVDYYKKQGYETAGPSAAAFGGGGWFDMTYDLTKTA